MVQPASSYEDPPAWYRYWWWLVCVVGVAAFGLFTFMVIDSRITAERELRNISERFCRADAHGDIDAESLEECTESVMNKGGPPGIP